MYINKSSSTSSLDQIMRGVFTSRYKCILRDVSLRFASSLRHLRRKKNLSFWSMCSCTTQKLSINLV